jgi:DNA-binding winged helix-turn-helix (wHTH) protein
MPFPSEWTFGPLRLDTANACLWRGEQMLALRPKAFAVLAYLVTHAGQLVTKEALVDAVWPGVAVSDTVLKACIYQIRRVLGETVETPQCIVTVHGRGIALLPRSLQWSRPRPHPWPQGHRWRPCPPGSYSPLASVRHGPVLSSLNEKRCSANSTPGWPWPCRDSGAWSW